MYDYQNKKNRLKRALWCFITSLLYIFKKKRNKNKDILCSNIGEIDYSIADNFKNDKHYREYRYEAYRISFNKKYLCYFYKDFKEVNKDEKLYIVEFPNNFNGIKLYFKYIYKLNPRFLQIHDSLTCFFQDFFIYKIFKPKIVFFPRGMNYYSDYIFRNKYNLIEFLKAIFNKFTYIYWLKKAYLVNAPAISALECELISKKYVHTSDYLFLQGACSLLFNKNNNEQYDTKYDFIKNYDYKLFTFSRVEKGKFIKEAIDSYIKIKDKLNKSSCLIIIGDGTYLSFLKNKYKEYKDIIFLGHINKEKALKLIEKFDLFLNPHGGYSLIETGFIGIPSISFNFNIMSTLVYNRVNGYLVDQNSPEEFTSTILEYFSKSKEDIEEFKKITKESFRKRFSKEALINERLKITKKIFN